MLILQSFSFFGYISIVMICPLYNKFFPLYQWLTRLLYLRNALLSVMMQQSCNNALPLLGKELAHMKYKLWEIL